MSENPKYTHEVVVIPAQDDRKIMKAGFIKYEYAHDCASHFAEARRLVIKGSMNDPRSFFDSDEELFSFVGIRTVEDIRNEALEVLKGDKNMLNTATQEPARQPIHVVDLSDLPQAVVGEELSELLPHPAEIPQSSTADPEMRS